MKTHILRTILLAAVILFAAGAARGVEEKDLLAILQSDADILTKCSACQQLRTRSA